MTADLESIYRKYVDYATRLQADLDRTSNEPIAPHFRLGVLSYRDFCRTWHHWAATEGLQEAWQRRFDQGYDRVAADLTERLTEALVGQSEGVSVSPAQDAA